MAWYVTVKDLVRELGKYDDDAVVLIGEDRESGESVEASIDLTYGYRTDEGEIVDEFDSSYEGSLAGKKRAVVIWGS